MSQRTRPTGPTGCAPRSAVFLLALLTAAYCIAGQQNSGTTDPVAQYVEQAQKEQPKKQPPSAKGELPQFEIIPTEPAKLRDAKKPDAATPTRPDPKTLAPRGKVTPKPIIFPIVPAPVPSA